MVRSTAEAHASEVLAGERFEFGKNWAAFLERLDESRIGSAEASLRAMLRVDRLDGRTFLDIGSGSGLFSLAARRLGARVHSFDFDPNSVACTLELRRRYFPADPHWVVEHGSVLDEAFMAKLGMFDVVYSWGVLHHTGSMWKALDNAQRLVAPGGLLFLAIYNDEGSRSRRWLRIKRLYNRLPKPLRSPFAVAVMAPQEIKSALYYLVSGRFQEYVKYTWAGPDRSRGMSHWHDIVDWVGGYPFEVATPDAMFEFHRDRGFQLEKLRCGGAGSGCNEFVFKRAGS